MLAVSVLYSKVSPKVKEHVWQLACNWHESMSPIGREINQLDESPQSFCGVPSKCGQVEHEGEKSGILMCQPGEVCLLLIEARK